jgi:hypothetical protein
MNGKNLFQIQLASLIAPKRVLRDQAYYLSQLSDGLIQAEVITTRGNKAHADCYIHTFQIHVPALDYSDNLFEISHPIDVYPVKVFKQDYSLERECEDAASFEATVAEILNSPDTKTRLEALKSQALAETVHGQPTEEVVRPVAEETASDHSDSEPTSAPATEASNPEESVAADTSQVAEFYDWQTTQFDGGHVERVPETSGAAIIYTPDEQPMFIAYSRGNIRESLLRQLSGRGSSAVKRQLHEGLKFACGKVSSQDEAEQTVKSMVGTMPFRALLGDSETSDWL